MREGPFAELLRGYRQAANLTQEELAERSGLSVQAISMLERGVRQAPRTSTVEYLARALALGADQRAALVLAATGGSRGTFPAPAELPRPLADHVGRVDTTSELIAVLAGAGQGGRIATIGGMGGIGKTSLAVRVAGEASAHFPDGVIYVDLKGTDSAPLGPGTVLTFLLRTLGVPEDDIPLDVDRRGALLRTTTTALRLLVVLDNARDAAQVRPLLPGSDRCGLLVTSRDRLAGLAGAHHVTLHPLDEQDSRALLSAVVGAGRLDAEPESAGELITRCAGHPLTLRIAGSRLAARPAATIRSLVDRLAHPPASIADLSAGDLVVRPMLESSFRRLLDDDRAAAHAFRLWGAWPGGDIGLPAICALLGRSRPETEHTLDELLDSHLLESPHTDAYRMHDLLMSYAQERAGADLSAEDRSAALARVTGWYLHATDRAVAQFAPYFRRLPFEEVPEPSELPEFPAASPALEWCDTERTNLLAVLHRAAEDGLDRMAWLLGTMLLPFCEQRMLWPEWVDSHTVALESARRDGDEVGQARAAGGLAAAYRRSNDPERAIVFATEALDILRRRGDHDRAANAMDTIARAQHDLGRLPEAMATLAAIADDERLTGFRRATSLCHLGMMKHEAGAADAIEVLHRALRVARQAAAPHAEIPTLQALGGVLWDRGELDAAVEVLTECVDRSRAVSDRIHEAEALDDLGRIAVAAGDRDTGRHRLTDAVELMAALGHPDETAVREALDALAADARPEPPDGTRRVYR